MNYHVLTLFPEMITNGVNTSITGRAIDKKLINLNAINIRDFSGNMVEEQECLCNPDLYIEVMNPLWKK